jgi:HAD superfamily hydrolase (TIGR01662 family)
MNKLTEKELILFDIDGTLTPSRKSSADPYIHEFLPKTKEKILDLKTSDKHYKIACITNQRRRHIENLALIDFIGWIMEELGIEAIYIASAGDPSWLKPSSALLWQAMSEFLVGPERTVFVGDSVVDMEAAESAGVDFIFEDEFFGR